MGGSSSGLGGGGSPPRSLSGIGSPVTAVPSTNNTLSQRMGLPGMEGSGVPMDPRVAQIMQRYGVRLPTSGTAPKPGTPPTTKPATPPAAPPRRFSWQFPQYSQTWAFTPPPPSSFTLPPMFDPKLFQSSTSANGANPNQTFGEAMASIRRRPDPANAVFDPRTG